jgi:hypothetical protein
MHTVTINNLKIKVITNHQVQKLNIGDMKGKKDGII